MADIAKDQADDFLAKWQGVAASELSTSQSFLADLCDLLGVDRPHPDESQSYMFERPVTIQHGDGSTSAGRIDLYRRGSFVLESKKLRQGEHTKGFDNALLRARTQAERYARNLPAKESRPPFVIVVDVGTRIELYSEFSRSGATYVPFPDPRSHRIALDRLRDPAVRERLKRIWTDPLSLDPSREAARVTREIAARLAELAKSLEQDGHRPELVAQFLMRCLFTMFAEDVGLLPEASFRNLLKQHLDAPDTAMRMLSALWQDMDCGGFSTVLASDVLQFNGKLFKSPDTLPLARKQIELLIEAARAKWEHVEPAIFGTLLERALSPNERHKLGAHYTPRAYVERLVLPTIIEPLRAEWSDVQAAAGTLSNEGKGDAAVAELKRFHHRLCSVRVLDPACGSGNFLYVTLEHLKRLEGEVLNALDELGYQQTDLALGGERADAAAGETVDPHNLLGIELNPRAAAIAEVVLWIGYLQWHFRTRGNIHPPQPVIRNFRNIEHRDAILAFDRVEYVTDEQGRPITRWDGESMKVSPVTGEKVPDESARMPLERYINPRKAAWPEADFVVGNPPFIGTKRMKSVLGEGYVDALRGVWTEVPESADFVMYWWQHAAVLAARGALERFGFITTNSLRQTFNREVLRKALSAKPPISIAFAVADHPWVDSADGAAVRIAMTVGTTAAQTGRLIEVIPHRSDADGEVDIRLVERTGRIHSDLRVGANIAVAAALQANRTVAGMGVALHGSGFILEPDTAARIRAQGASVVKPYLAGRDLLQVARERYVIDFFGLAEQEARAANPAAFQHVFDYVKPERDHNKRDALKRLWWRFGWERPQLRAALSGQARYIVTTETSKHRPFQFLGTDVLADHSIVCIAVSDGAALGILSSQVHVTWALAAGARLGVGNDPRYNKTRCFDPFPFPDFHAAQAKPSPSRGGLGGDGVHGGRALRQEKTHPHPGLPLEREGDKRDAEGDERALVGRIRELGEQLDAHRKRQQAAHPDLTLTGMYNVLEKLRSGEALTAKERSIHEQGLVSVLRQLHDELDAAVLEAYAWSDLLPLLRTAHGLHPSPPGRRWREAPDEGSMSAKSAHDSEHQPPIPLPTGDGSQAEAKRAFDEAILERLVALNAERAAEEARGLIRWLRPEFLNPCAATAPVLGKLPASTERTATDPASGAAVATTKKQKWPKETVAQVHAVLALLEASPVPLGIEEITANFTAKGPWKKRLPQLLDMLVAVGRAELNPAGYTRT